MISSDDTYSIFSLSSLDLSVNNPDCKRNDVNKYGPIMRVINNCVNDFVSFINDQDNPKNNNPRTKHEFSLKLKLLIFLKKK